jgi:hypothetical protein
VRPAGPRVRRAPVRVRLPEGRAPASSGTPAGPRTAKIFAVAGVQPPMGPAGPLEPRRAASSGTPTGHHPGVSSVAEPGPLLMTSVTTPGPLLTTTPAGPRGPRGVTVFAAPRRLLAVAASAADPGRRRVTGLVTRLAQRLPGPGGPRQATAHATRMLHVSAGDLDVMTGEMTGATATGGPPATTAHHRAIDPAGQTILVPAPAPAGHGPRTATAIPTTVARDPVQAGPVPATVAELAVKARGRPPLVLPTARPVLLPTARPVLPPTGRPVLPRTGRPVLPRTGRPVLLPTACPVLPRTGRPVLLPTGQPGRPGRMVRLRGLSAVREDRAMAVPTARRGRIAEVTGRKNVPEAGDPRTGRTRGVVPEVRSRRTSRVRPARRFPIRSAPSSSIPKHGPS